MDTHDPKGTAGRLAATLTSAPFVMALIVLLANDWWLKEAFPGFVTGKLSDFAGIAVVALPLFAVARRGWWVYLLLLGAFAWWKSPLSAQFIGFANAWLPMRIGRVVDYGDLAALCLLPLWHWLATSRPRQGHSPPQLRRVLLWPVSLVAVFGVMGTSKVAHDHMFMARAVDSHVLSRDEVAAAIRAIASEEKLECADCAHPTKTATFKGHCNKLHYTFESDTEIRLNVYEYQRIPFGESADAERRRIYNAVTLELPRRYPNLVIEGR